MNNKLAVVAGAVLDQAHRDIAREFPHADQAKIATFLKMQFHRANSGGEQLNAKTIVARYRALNTEK